MVSQEQQVVEREQSRFNSTSNSPSKADQLLREAFIRKWQCATSMRLFAMIVSHSAPLSSLDRTTTFRRDDATRFRDIAQSEPRCSFVSRVSCFNAIDRRIARDHGTPFHCSPLRLATRVPRVSRARTRTFDLV